jgi:NADPH:quinone reductase-like Zn-dependent oxidoreductase
LAGVAAAVRHGGQIVTITATTTESVPGRDDLDVPSAMSTHIDDGDLEELARRAVAGELPVTISRTYALEDGVQAYVDLKRRHTFGKLVVTVP